MNARMLPLAFASILICSLASAQGANAAAPIPQGTTITGTLQTALDTGKSRVGDGFSILVTRPYPDGDAGYAGAVIRGHVANVVGAGQGRKPELDLAFDSIVLSDGSTAPLSGHVLTAEQKKKSGILTQAIGAGAGMIVGNIIGKTIFGTNLGGLVGAAGGFAYANNHKQDFVVPSDTLVTLQTDEQVPRPQARY